MITVGRKKDKGAQYIGRGSPLGNPFHMKDKFPEERDRVCDEYEEWFREKVRRKDSEIIAELDRLTDIALDHALVLGCFCSPLRYHGETIKQYLEDRINFHYMIKE